MFQPDTTGHFGRQNRFRHGPFKVVRTTHPRSGAFLQLPSEAAGRNLRQYCYSLGVHSVLADHQVPPWIARYVPGRTAHTAQLIELDDGAQLICMARKNVTGGSDGHLEQLHGHLWRVERSWAHIDQECNLNKALELLCQAKRGTLSDAFVTETTAIISALQRCRSCTVGELTTYLAVSAPVAEGVLETVVARMMLAGRLGADLRDGWNNKTLLHWQLPGTGYLPPLPGNVTHQEAA